jgi:DNA modification methylase
MRELSIEYIPLDELKPRMRPDNPKLHDLDGIIASSDRFGFITPILLNDADGTEEEGHGRTAALLRLKARSSPAPEGIHVGDDGEWLVPVIRGVHLAPEDAKAYLIAANRLVESGGWDGPKLTALVAELQASGAGLDGIGFSAQKLEALLADLPSAPPVQPDADEAPPLPARRATWVRPQNLFRLGDHLLACADCRAPGLLELPADGRSVEGLWTDSPYGGDYVGRTKRRLPIHNDDAEGLEALVSVAFAAVDAILEPGAAFYVAHPAGRNHHAFLTAFAGLDWDLRQDLVWVKDRLVVGHSDYQFRHEAIFYGFKPGQGRHGRGGKRWFGGNDVPSIFEFPSPRASRDHPTMKPVGLVSATLRNSTRRGETVVDPFLGSGTTLIACEQLGRRCLGVEIDPAYVQVTIEDVEVDQLRVAKAGIQEQEDDGVVAGAEDGRPVEGWPESWRSLQAGTAARFSARGV